MDNEWLEIAFINFDEAILHGQLVDGRDADGCLTERQVRVVLTEENLRSYNFLAEQHRREVAKLLRAFAIAEVPPSGEGNCTEEESAPIDPVKQVAAIFERRM